MGFYTGSTGTIQFKKRNIDYQDNSANNLRIVQWTMNSSAQLLDVTTLGDYDKNSVYGLRTYTGTPGCCTTPTKISLRRRGTAAAWFIGALSKLERLKTALTVILPTTALLIHCPSS